MNQLIVILIVLLAFPATGFGQGEGERGSSTVISIQLPEVPVTLKEGRGQELVTRYCSICHTVGYIPLQPGFSQEKWAGIVHKMMNVYGAPVPQEDADRIIEYLGAHYGPEQNGEGKE